MTKYLTGDEKTFSTQDGAVFAISIGLNLVLITDRTQADVDARNDKGTYNATDLNRVGTAMQYVADTFSEMGYDINLKAKRDWMVQDIPTSYDMAKYLSDLSVLRGVVAVMTTTPKVPADMDDLVYQEANDIEQILLDVHTLLQNISAAWFYSGDLYSGEV